MTFDGFPTLPHNEFPNVKDHNMKGEPMKLKNMRQYHTCGGLLATVGAGGGGGSDGGGADCCGTCWAAAAVAAAAAAEGGIK